MRILSIDPGGTTGYTFMVCSENPTHMQMGKSSGGQLGPDPHHAELHCLLDDYDPTVVVCEEFTYRIVGQHGSGSTPGVNLISKEYIGVVKLWVVQYPDIWTPTLYMQMPYIAVGKQAFWSNDKLKQLGLYKRGKPHQNDATRHLLYCLTDKLNYKWPLYMLNR